MAVKNLKIYVFALDLNYQNNFKQHQGLTVSNFRQFLIFINFKFFYLKDFIF